MENAEINNMIKIIGLQYKRQYTTDQDLDSLRYGKIMIMADQVPKILIKMHLTIPNIFPRIKTVPTSKAWSSILSMRIGHR
jgi:hypothetical protein